MIFKNTTKHLLLALALWMVGTSLSWAWDAQGHDVSCVIAQKFLTKKAKKNIARYLDGKNIVFYASFMDYRGYVDSLGYTFEWFDHCVPVDRNFNYAPGQFYEGQPKQNGDAGLAVLTAIERMKDGGYKTLSDSLVNLYIKHLVHFLPDSHTPSHLIYNFRSTNYWVGTGGDSKALFHGIWDAIPERYGVHHWSNNEWCEYLTESLTKQQIAEIQSGTFEDWVHQNAVDCMKAYEIVREGDSLQNPDCWEATVLTEQQLLRAGLHLAKVLNDIFNK